ncbi:MAG TPA: molybdate ABC transporter substrate-binding protein [Pyrinomonadaceae bacterium]|nr:molybdate ABC transporter substrate-binding protein [Pyrinomonadaceae bacterium]
MSSVERQCPMSAEAKDFGIWTLVAGLVFALALISLTACKPNLIQTTKQITVAAAADLGPAFDEIGRAFEAESRTKVIFSFGSTGMLTQQIENGAPMDVFAAADVSYIDQLERKGFIVSGTRAIYALGRITIWTRKTAALKPQQLAELTRPEVKRIAIANPGHAPYGLAARQALEAAGVWDEVKPKLIYGDNIRQALQFAQTGNVDVAIVALSLSLPSDGYWVLIPAELHKPLNQGLGVVKGTAHESDARNFASFVNSAAGRKIMQKYGFTLPGDEPVPQASAQASP